MGTVERPADRGRRLARAALRHLGEQARRARVAAGLSQAEVARAAGLSRSVVGRFERGQSTSIRFEAIGAILGTVGLDLWTRAYSVAEPQRDAAHARLLERLRSRLPVGLDWWTEVPFPNAGDLRSWDGMVRPQGLRVAVEAETRPGDGQELQRRMARKRRDGEVDRLILLLADTRWNRLLVREYQGQWAADFPVPGRRALRALERGLDPGGDAIILL